MTTTAITDLVARDLYRVKRASSRVLSRLPPEDGLENRVDLNRGEFVCVGEDDAGAPVVRESGRLQLIGHWSAKRRRFTWGFLRPDLVDSIAREIRDAIRAVGDLHGHFDPNGIPFDSARDALDFASWVAMKIGWLGAWPAEDGDDVYLCALRLEGRHHPVESTAADWCTTCGFDTADVMLHHPEPGVALCERCSGDIADMFSGLTEVSDGHSASPPFAACIVCGSRRSGNVGFAYGFVCRACAIAASVALRGSDH